LRSGMAYGDMPVSSFEQARKSHDTLRQVTGEMKIVFLAPFGIRPKGTVPARMIPLAMELRRLGHEVVIVAPPYTNPEESGREEWVSGIRLRNVALPRTSSSMLAAPVLSLRLYAAV